MQPDIAETSQYQSGADQALTARARHRDAGAFREIMQKYNRRLYRIARGILGNDADAEDAVQETYVRAFTHIEGFRGEARLSTWLTRITINEALGRLKQRRPSVDVGLIDTMNEQGEARVIILPSARHDGDPEAAAARAEVRHLLERAMDRLPDRFRIVFILRDIEEMSIEETATELGLRPETVKTRLHRARLLLRQTLDKTLSDALSDTFPFAGARCARITRTVFERLGLPDP